MDFITQRNYRSVRWDLLIRVLGKLVGNHMCLQGNIQASFLYKDITLATSSIQSYNKLEAGMPHLFNISVVASKEELSCFFLTFIKKDLSGVLEKEIIEAIKEKKEVRFRSRLAITDCREDEKKGTVSYECGETTLQFEPSDSEDQIKAIAFGKRPTCKISL